MGALSTDQSMEEILSSIKRIIADEDSNRAAGGGPRPPRRKAAAKASAPVDEAADEENVLELTEAIDTVDAEGAAPAVTRAQDQHQDADEDNEAMAKPATSATQDAPAAPVLSDSSAAAIRQSLSSLSSLLVKPAADAPSNTLEGLVQEMLRPMLKEWLDANLPGMVETMVKREIEKITGSV